MMTTVPRQMLLCLVPLLGMVACKATPPTHFYVLTSRADAEPKAGTRSEDGMLLGVGPIEIPDYLDQPEIVTRASANALTLAEFDQWAEPLVAGVTRVLAEDLAQLLPVDRIVLFPWKREDAIQAQVLVRLGRFEVVSDQAWLAAEWQVVSGDGTELAAGRSSYSSDVSSPGYAGKVAAMSRVLADLSQELADVLRDSSGR